MAGVRIERRSWSARIALVCSTLAAVGFSITVIRDSGIVIAVACFCGAILMAALAFRPRAKRVPGALCSRPADLLSDSGKKLPGQLSISSTGITWVPNNYSVARGAREWSASTTEGLHLSLQRGSALLDLILTAETADANIRRFLTHRSQGLRNAVEQLSDSESGPLSAAVSP